MVVRYLCGIPLSVRVWRYRLAERGRSRDPAGATMQASVGEKERVSQTYSRSELDQRFMERREEFLRLFRSRVIQREVLPNTLSLQLREEPDGRLTLVDPEGFQDMLTEYMAAAFVEGLKAFLDVVFDE